MPPHVSKTYQMLYVSKFDTVLGASTPFRIFDETSTDKDANAKALECVEKHIDGAGTVTMVVPSDKVAPNGKSSVKPCLLQCTTLYMLYFHNKYLVYLIFKENFAHSK